MPRHRNNNEFYQWRPNWYGNSKNHQIDFREWLIDQGADIYTDLKFNELFKFSMGKTTGYVWHTGMCCPVFRKWLKVYKEILKGKTS